jgi:hypothetical protein
MVMEVPTPITIFFMKLKFKVDLRRDKQYAQKATERSYIETIHASSRSYLLQTASQYQSSWDEINDAFSLYIEKTTGHAWKHSEYICVVSAYHGGIANWGDSNIILRTWDENPFTQRRITAHELIISHYWTIILKHHPNHGLTDMKIWALSEIAAFALTSLPKEVQAFWPWDTNGYYTKHNYQSIVPIQKKLKRVFLGMNSFDEYMKVGMELARKEKNIKFG